MKNFDKILIFNLLILFAISTQAQNYQMPKWPFNGKYIDFSVYGNPQVFDMDSYLDGAKGSTGGYYDTNNALLFNVIDTRLYAPNGDFKGYLYTDSDATPDMQCGEMIIVPVVKQNSCKYWVIYPMQVYNNDNTTYWKVCYNIVCSYGPTILESGVISSTLGTWHGGIAMSDFLPNTDAHRLFIVAPSANTTIVQQWTIDDRISLLTTAEFGAPSIDIAELDLSTDRTMLVCAKLNLVGYDALGENVVVFHYLSNGNVNMDIDDGMTILDIGTANATNEQFTGIEVYQSPSTPSQKYIYVSKSGGLRYQINMTNPNIPITTIVNNSNNGSQSFIEWDYDYKVSSSNGSNGLLRNDPGSTTATLTPLNDNYNPVKNLYISDFHTNAPDVYTLPDQIDGCTYQYTTGTEVNCCEAIYESSKKREINGVSFDDYGNVTILSGYTLTWNQWINPFGASGSTVTDIYLKGNLTIQPGAKLTINGLTLYFKEGKEVQLDYSPSSSLQGARLSLANSTLTVFDECNPDAMWEGVDLSGLSSLPQSTSSTRQPYLFMNNSMIEFANYGVQASAGGLLIAWDSNFKDNIVDVSFTSYYPTNGNLSEFYRCDFYTTNELYQSKNQNPTYHAHIYQANGVDFKGCNFYNNYAYNNGISNSYWGIGVLSTSSYLTILPYSGIRGEFSHLRYGIKADQGDYFTLNQCDFIDCMVGSWFIGNDGITATENTFDVFDSANTNMYFGLYLESSTGYHVEQNTFYDGVVGLVVYNSGAAENLIYRNSFNNLTGIAAANLGQNYGSDCKTGVQYLCNNFDEVEYAMTVVGGSLYTSGGTINVTKSDIRIVQGVITSNNSKVSTMNYFTNMPTADVYFLIDDNYSYALQFIGDYIYNHHIATGYFLGSGCYDPNDVIPSIKNTYACASALTTGGVLQMMQTIGDLNNEEEELESNYEEMLSFNQVALLDAATTANSINASNVYNTLYEASPYLTSEILLAYLNNAAISDLSKVSLLIANSPLPIDVINNLESSGLPAEYAAYIIQCQQGINPLDSNREMYQNIISAKQVSYDGLIRETFAADTTVQFNDMYQMVLGFMANQTDIHAQKSLVQLYIHKAQYDYALDVLSTIADEATSKEDVNLANYAELSSIQVEILQNVSTSTVLEVVKRHEDFLTAIAADYNTKEGGIARAILESAGLMVSEPFVFMPTVKDTKSARINVPEKENIVNSSSLNALLRIYPNPANDQLAIEFVNPQEGNCTFNIYSLKGELLQTVNSNQQLGFISIHVSSLAPGSYIIECPQLNAKQSFIISR